MLRFHLLYTGITNSIGYAMPKIPSEITVRLPLIPNGCNKGLPIFPKGIYLKVIKRLEIEHANNNADVLHVSHSTTRLSQKYRRNCNFAMSFLENHANKFNLLYTHTHARTHARTHSLSHTHTHTHTHISHKGDRVDFIKVYYTYSY